MKRVEYEVLNWKKYNPRSDVRQLSWYRQEIGIFDHPEYEHLTVGAKVLYYLLMDTAAKRHGIGKTTVRHMHRHTRLKQHRIKETLSHFEDIGLIKVNFFGTEVTGPLSYATERNETERNGTERNDTVSYTPRTVRTRTKAPKAVASEGDLSLGEEWFKYAHEVMEWQTAFSPDKFAGDIAKVKKATNLNDDGIRAVLSFVAKDDFWRNKAVSPIGLLKKNQGGVRKIDTILSQMKPKEDATDRALREFANSTHDIPEIPF